MQRACRRRKQLRTSRVQAWRAIACHNERRQIHQVCMASLNALLASDARPELGVMNSFANFGHNDPPPPPPTFSPPASPQLAMPGWGMGCG
eukprot:3706844-Alexandrium_andersonii.AAC.1